MPTPVWAKKVSAEVVSLEDKAKNEAAQLEAWAFHGKDAVVAKTESTFAKVTGYKFLWPILGGVVLVIGYILL